MAMSTGSKRRLMVAVAAGLGYDWLERRGCVRRNGLTFAPLAAPFPGLTCPVQATLRTGLAASGHGIPANGLWFDDLRRPLFWEQSARLVSGPRIWQPLRERGGRVALLFWQQSLGEDADAILSPMPVHRHGGGLVEAVYSRPADLYDEVRQTVGSRFRLARYWGPLASAASSRWIAQASAAVMQSRLAPDLCLTYLPGLDYDLQRYGPESMQAEKALASVMEDIGILQTAGQEGHWDLLVVGDYAMGDVSPGGAVYPNRLLRKLGWFQTRSVRGLAYPDFHASLAFAVADHELAFVRADEDVPHDQVAAALAALPGVGQVLRPADLRAAGLAHPRGGDLALVAAPGHWFAYPWWEDPREAPDYASHVDIHNKPGYDPCELFLGWPPFTVTRNAERIRGTHGRGGDDRRVAWAATGEAAAAQIGDLAGLAAHIKRWCEG